MTEYRMIELALLSLFNLELNSMSSEQYREIQAKYDLNKMSQRSKELSDEFLKPYVKDTNDKPLK